MVQRNDKEIGYTLEELQEGLSNCSQGAQCATCPFRECCKEDSSFVFDAAFELIRDQHDEIKSKSLLLTYMEVSLADALASVKDAVETMDEYEKQIAALEKENDELKQALRS